MQQRLVSRTSSASTCALTTCMGPAFVPRLSPPISSLGYEAKLYSPIMSALVPSGNETMNNIVLKEPVQVIACGRRFCKGCIGTFTRNREMFSGSVYAASFLHCHSTTETLNPTVFEFRRGGANISRSIANLFKPLSCQLSTANVDCPQQRWTRQLLRGSALLPRPSMLKLASLFGKSMVKSS